MAYSFIKQTSVTYELYLDSECSDDSFGSFLWFKSGCQFLYWTSCDNKVVDIYQCLDWQNTSCNACSLDLSGTAGQCTTDPSGIWMMMTCTGGVWFLFLTVYNLLIGQWS